MQSIPWAAAPSTSRSRSPTSTQSEGAGSPSPARVRASTSVLEMLVPSMDAAPITVNRSVRPKWSSMVRVGPSPLDVAVARV